jgi:hypothetical protein
MLFFIKKEEEKKVRKEKNFFCVAHLSASNCLRKSALYGEIEGITLRVLCSHAALQQKEYRKKRYIYIHCRSSNGECLLNGDKYSLQLASSNLAGTVSVIPL